MGTTVEGRSSSSNSSTHRGHRSSSRAAASVRGATSARASTSAHAASAPRRSDEQAWGAVAGLSCVESSKLPSALDLPLFDDAFTGSTNERTCRPGRGDGLADTIPSLCLFKQVLPETVKQGELGNCWLISVLCVLAEKADSILNLCDQQSLSHDGRYDIHLFHPVHEVPYGDRTGDRWWLPCSTHFLPADFGARSDARIARRGSRSVSTTGCQ